MAILGTLLKKGITLRESLEQFYTSPLELQKGELRNLLIHAQHTQFGKTYRFSDILAAFKEGGSGFYQAYTHNVPIHDYDKIYQNWWLRARDGAKDVAWPGKIKYFALSSGTSGASSKYIPITKEMVKSIRKTSVRQILTMSKYDLPASLYSKGVLMLGGSTNLRKSGHYFEGDLSGITASQIPFWFQNFYKPGKKIAKTTDWHEKLDEIVKKAPEWDIGIIVGVPAWLQMLIEKIVAHYQVPTIHDIWPNLRIFVHGGVAFKPYKNGFEKLLSHPLYYMETYLASEGFIAFQASPDRPSMKLVLNNGIFYEFIPFDPNHFDDYGELLPSASTLQIDEVREGIEYALVISTNAGTWRYLIGDVVKFVSIKDSEIIITGRTKLFMSLCGEHLSIDNMNQAIEMVEKDMGVDIKEFTLLGERSGSFFAHHWFLGMEEEVDMYELSGCLDSHLKNLNDDYKVERGSALQELRVSRLPTGKFYEWMEIQGKIGSQNKFPRVLKKEKAAAWKAFLSSAN